ncbi:MAG: hypothetical protein E7294_15135 [Lachnospiraceae bacterium]|nr:hypothetical protein [Lachnospiraceae bacterium]
MKRKHCIQKITQIGIGITALFFIRLSSVYGEQYQYDSLNRVQKVIYEDGSYMTYSYDVNSNIKSIRQFDAAGKEKSNKASETITDVKEENENNNGKETGQNQIDIPKEQKPMQADENLTITAKSDDAVFLIAVHETGDSSAVLEKLKNCRE